VELTISNHTLEISNPDKLMFPKVGATKKDVVEYYRQVADTMLPHVRERPVTMHRYPDGVDGKSFYQKEMSDYFPDWIDSVKLKKKEGGSTEYVVCNNAATLCYLAGQACLTPHIWLSPADKPDNPNRLIFDLDPPEDGFEMVRRAAQSMRGFFENELQVAAHVMTSGSKGLHVVIPLDGKDNFDDVREAAQMIADIIADRNPEELTTEVRKEKRSGRLFLDTARNAWAQTAVAPYSLRARDRAPIATPLDWAEIDNSQLHAQTYRLENIFRRLGQKGDPWSEIGRHAVALKTIKKALDKLPSPDRES
jgi:bifunctional non-homologous end joining protein LigD